VGKRHPSDKVDAIGESGAIDMTGATHVTGGTDMTGATDAMDAACPTDAARSTGAAPASDGADPTALAEPTDVAAATGAPATAGASRADDTAGARERFLALLRAAVDAGSFDRLVLTKPRESSADLQRVLVRALVLRGERRLQLVYSHATRDVTKNIAPGEALAAIAALLGDGFAHAHLHTVDTAAELRISRKGRAGLSVRKAARPATAEAGTVEAVVPHDRIKRRFVDIRRRWLADLGVTDAQGRLVPSMARKWKQINKFVEVFDHAIATSRLAATTKPITVIDFGSGKGYLTFAVHDHLRHALGRDADVTGVELRPDLVDLSNRAAARAAADGLRFVTGDIRSHEPGPIDVMIALHACDTATDHALARGLRGGAEVILCSPCCHKQLRPQMRAPAPLQPMLQHGIHLGQQAEMVTDSLRALLLEAEGYATQVFEFVALEHTSKNKMILAVRRPRPIDRTPIEAQIGEIKAFYGIREHCLETLLAAKPSTGRSAEVAPA
jgi:SAM-dependent methyltransferase